MNVVQLFPISVCIDKIPVDSDTKEYLKNQKYSKILYNGFPNGLISEDKSILDLDGCKQLKEQIQEKINDCVLNYYHVDFDGNFYIHRSWTIIHQPGNWSHAHSHNNSIVSGVYYLDCFPDSGAIKFYKPEGYLNNLSTGTISFQYNEHHEHNSETWSIVPKSGTTMLFPSKLKHSVDTNNSNETRMCLAFDVFVEGALRGDKQQDLVSLTLEKNWLLSRRENMYTKADLHRIISSHQQLEDEA